MRRSSLAPSSVSSCLLALLVASSAAALSCSGSSSPGANDGDASLDGTSGDDPIGALPVVQTIAIQGLLAPVRFVRDKRGMQHIYAQNEHDAFLAQGYLVAQDRAPQLEIFRRLAEGRLASLFGSVSPSLGAQDLYFRALGLRRTAEAEYAAMAADSEVKLVVDAYAAGITAYFQAIRNRKVNYPSAWGLLPRAQYLDWDGAASLALARLQTWNLSWDADTELQNTALLDAFQSTFNDAASDPAFKLRAAFIGDLYRVEPPAKTPVVPMPTGAPKATARSKPAQRPALPKELVADTMKSLTIPRTLDALLGPRGSTGSNNWIVSPGKSATGKSLVASDPHLTLRAPAVFHMVALHVADPDPSKQLDIAGMSFAGIPGVVLGFTKSIAWGATVAYFDVNDLYRDKLVAGSATIGGKQVAIVPIQEQLDYGDGAGPQPITIETLPGHGVIFPSTKDNRFVARTSNDVIAYRWTGFEPSGELAAFVALSHAKNVDEARTAMEPFQVGAQNFVFGDTSGNILYTTHSRVPVRPAGALKWDPNTAKGTLPCLVLPGDQGLEWTGDVRDDLLPHAKNPAANYVATANADQYGLTFDNDPTNDGFYLGCNWDPGFRNARVHERIEAKDKLSLDDLAAIQADAKSPLGSRLAKYFVAAIQRAEDSRTGKTPAPDLAAVLGDPRYVPAKIQRAQQLLTAWKDADYDTPSAVAIAGDPDVTAAQLAASQATVVFNAALVPLFKYAFDDEWKAMGSPSWDKEMPMRALVRILEKPSPLLAVDANGESVAWDDLTTKGVIETKDDRLLRALLDGLDFVEKALGTDPAGWQWGKLHTIRFESLLTGSGATLSIPREGDARFPAGGFPRHGDEHVVDAAHYGLGGLDYSYSYTYGNGPAQRFVASMEDALPTVRNALPGGNVWVPADTHFDDEAQLWRKNLNAPVPFAPADVAGGAELRFDLVPSGS